MLLRCSSGAERYAGGVKEEKGGNWGDEDQIVRNTIYSYSGLRWLPPRWKENVLYLHLSVLCDVGEICVYLFVCTYNAFFHFFDISVERL